MRLAKVATLIRLLGWGRVTTMAQRDQAIALVATMGVFQLASTARMSLPTILVMGVIAPVLGYPQNGITLGRAMSALHVLPVTTV